jgi:hypothetical protein
VINLSTAERASFLGDNARRDLAARVADNPRKFSARKLGTMLNLTDEERTLYQAWTIAAVDVSDEERAERRKRKHRERQAKQRASNKTHKLTAFKPWEFEGVSRKTWERGRKNGTESVTGLALAIKWLLEMNDEKSVRSIPCSHLYTAHEICDFGEEHQAEQTALDELFDESAKIRRIRPATASGFRCEAVESEHGGIMEGMAA